MQIPDSSSPAAAAKVFLDSVTGKDSAVSPEEMLSYATKAATEVLSDAQHAPIVVGYEKLPHLTKQQREILEMLNTGRTPKQVAAQLFKTESTVEKHVGAINKAFGTHWYQDSVEEARRMGILAYPEVA